MAGRTAASPALGGRTAWIVLAVGQCAAAVAVLQRSSLGVATTDALARFGITAATLATFALVQLVVYAALQVPVGVLIDRYGSKRLIVAGSLVMAGAQAMFAFTGSLPLAFVARVVLGAGDALTFISVMRLVPAWFPPQRSGRVTNLVGPMNQLGLILSALPFAAVLAGAGWTAAFLTAAAVSVLAAGLVLAVVRDAPHGRPSRTPLRRAVAVAVRDVRDAWAEPGTRLGFWLAFVALFPPMMFGVMWGYPFLVVGEGLAPGVAGTLITMLALIGVVYGATLGTLMGRHPYQRSRIAVAVAAVTIAVWTVVLLWPGRAPLWLLVTLVLVLPANGVPAVASFDFARTFNRPSRLGSAIGVVNVGGFSSTLLAVIGIGVVLQVLSPPGSRDYSLAAFKWAFAIQYLLWALGIAQVLRYRRRTLRLVAERDPEGYAALRRGVHLAPPADPEPAR